MATASVLQHDGGSAKPAAVGVRVSEIAIELKRVMRLGGRRPEALEGQLDCPSQFKRVTAAGELDESAAATSDGSLDLLLHLQALLQMDAARRVLVGALDRTRERRSGAATIRVVTQDVDPCASLGQPARVAVAGVPVIAVPGPAGLDLAGGPGLVVPGVLLALALLALLLQPALASPLRRRRRRLTRRLLHFRRRWCEAAARRREAALERRGGLWWAQAGSDLDGLKARVIDAFDPVQWRWHAPDVKCLRGYVSDAFYDRYRRELQRLEAHHQTRRIVVSRFDGVEIVAFGASGELVRVVAHVRFSAYETLSDSRNARVIEGVPGKRRVCREYWTLVSHPAQGWVVDDIERRPRGRAAVEFAPTVTVRVARGATDALGRVAQWFEHRRLRLPAATRKHGRYAQPSSATSRRSSADDTATIAWTGTNTGANTPGAYVDGTRARRPDQLVKRRTARRR